MLTINELMEASRTYERGYKCAEELFEWCLDVDEEAEGDPWKIAERKKELQGIMAKGWNWTAKAQEEHLEIYLAMLWAKPLGLWPTRAEKMASRQILGNPNGTYESRSLGRSLFDHTYWFREGRGRPTRWDRFVIATHPYGVAEEYKADAKSYADEVGASVDYPKFPSWWVPAEFNAEGKFCGGTTLVVWKAMENAEAVRPQGLFNSISERLDEVETIEGLRDGVLVKFKDGSERFVKGEFGHKLHYKWCRKLMKMAG